MKTREQRQWQRSFGDFFVNFEPISHLFLASLSLTLNKKMLDGYLFIEEGSTDAVHKPCDERHVWGICM